MHHASHHATGRWPLAARPTSPTGYRPGLVDWFLHSCSGPRPMLMLDDGPLTHPNLIFLISHSHSPSIPSNRPYPLIHQHRVRPGRCVLDPTLALPCGSIRTALETLASDHSHCAGTPVEPLRSSTHLQNNHETYQRISRGYGRIVSQHLPHPTPAAWPRRQRLLPSLRDPPARSPPPPRTITT